MNLCGYVSGQEASPININDPLLKAIKQWFKF